MKTIEEQSEIVNSRSFPTNLMGRDILNEFIAEILKVKAGVGSGKIKNIEKQKPSTSGR
jgi:hypothetical protein